MTIVQVLNKPTKLVKVIWKKKRIGVIITQTVYGKHPSQFTGPPPALTLTKLLSCSKCSFILQGHLRKTISGPTFVMFTCNKKRIGNEMAMCGYFSSFSADYCHPDPSKNVYFNTRVSWWLPGSTLTCRIFHAHSLWGIITNISPQFYLQIKWFIWLNSLSYLTACVSRPLRLRLAMLPCCQITDRNDGKNYKKET